MGAGAGSWLLKLYSGSKKWAGRREEGRENRKWSQATKPTLSDILPTP